MRSALRGRPQRRRGRNGMDRLCSQCASTLVSGRRLYCSACQLERERKRKRIWAHENPCFNRANAARWRARKRPPSRRRRKVASERRLPSVSARTAERLQERRWWLAINRPYPIYDEEFLVSPDLSPFEQVVRADMVYRAQQWIDESLDRRDRSLIETFMDCDLDIVATAGMFGATPDSTSARIAEIRERAQAVLSG